MADILDILQSAGLDNAAQESVWITADASDESEAQAWARRRAAGEPLQYILGTVAFRNLNLTIGPGAFIPRPETELVAGLAIELLPEGGTAVDLCTGSGAIALALAAERPDAKVLATEISGAAMDWAHENNGDEKVEFLAGDLYEPLGRELRGAVDVLVANPPYISWDEVDRLPPDVIDHEPHVALFAAGSGLQVMDRIITQAPMWLRPGGWLVLEIGESLGGATSQALVAAGLSHVTISQDLANKDRIASGMWP